MSQVAEDSATPPRRDPRAALLTAVAVVGGSLAAWMALPVPGVRPGWVAHLVTFVLGPGLVLAALGVAFVAVGSPSRAGAVVRVLRAPARGGGSPRWAWAGLLGVLVAFAGLEAMQPFYFTQDDAFAIELPALLQMARSLAGGVLPVWNPYSFGGVPTLSLGTSSLTWPPVLASWVVAKALGNEYLTFEVYALLHLVGGYLLATAAARDSGVRWSLSALAGLAWALDGYLLLAGRGWHMTLALEVFLPATAWALLRLENRGGGVGWMALTGGVLGLALHAMGAQIWAYLGLFYALWLLLVAAPRARRDALGWGVGAGLLGVGLAAPVLVLQAKEFATIHREAWGGDVLWALPAMLLPWPLATAGNPNGWGADHMDVHGHLFYDGTVLTAVAMAAGALLVAVAVRYRVGVADLAARQPALVCGLLAFLLALGFHGPVYPLMAHVPPFDGMNSPFKFLPFVHGFFGLAAVAVADRVLDARAERRFVGVAVALLAWHVGMCRSGFYNYQDRPPYPPLPADLAGALDGSRVVAIAPDRSYDADVVSSLKMGWPDLYGVLTLDGYHDNMVELRPEVAGMRRRLAEDPVGAARAWNVRWLWISHLADVPHPSGNPTVVALEQVRDDDLAVRAGLEPAGIRRLPLRSGTLVELPDPDPLAFAADRRPLPVRLDGAGAHVVVDGVHGDVTVGILWWPWLVATVDGVPRDVSKDDWGRVHVEVGDGGHALDVVYRPPWGTALAAGAALCGLAAALGAALRRLGGSTG